MESDPAFTSEQPMQTRLQHRLARLLSEGQPTASRVDAVASSRGVLFARISLRRLASKQLRPRGALVLRRRGADAQEVVGDGAPASGHSARLRGELGLHLAALGRLGRRVAAQEGQQEEQQQRARQGDGEDELEHRQRVPHVPRALEARGGAGSSAPSRLVEEEAVALLVGARDTPAGWLRHRLRAEMARRVAAEAAVGHELLVEVAVEDA
mmetsp:Transcript_68700/g.121490  ORF Transcript_68700/g.121490 Transcript_68700/m.121490 type:complete len:211 (+) Transcript_68700:413-1045(+)